MQRPNEIDVRTRSRLEFDRRQRRQCRQQIRSCLSKRRLQLTPLSACRQLPRASTCCITSLFASVELDALLQLTQHFALRGVEKRMRLQRQAEATQLRHVDERAQNHVDAANELLWAQNQRAQRCQSRCCKQRGIDSGDACARLEGTAAHPAPAGRFTLKADATPQRSHVQSRCLSIVRHRHADGELTRSSKGADALNGMTVQHRRGGTDGCSCEAERGSSCCRTDACACSLARLRFLVEDMRGRLIVVAAVGFECSRILRRSTDHSAGHRRKPSNHTRQGALGGGRRGRGGEQQT